MAPRLPCVDEPLATGSTPVTTSDQIMRQELLSIRGLLGS